MIEIPAESQGYADGRQSETALKIQRGCMRFLAHLGYASVAEIALANGRRADLVAVHQDGHILIVEIKSSRQDFQIDQKWPDYLEFCDSFAFACLASGPVDLFPTDQALIICDEYGGHFERVAERQKLSAARRKAMMQRLFRASARRLHKVMDPGVRSFLIK